MSVIAKLVPAPALTKPWGNNKQVKPQEAADKLTALCQLFSRPGFLLNWSCQDDKQVIPPNSKDIEILFTINKEPAFIWKFMPTHTMIQDVWKDKGRKDEISFQHPALSDPYLQSWVITFSDVKQWAKNKTQGRALEPYHIWGLNIQDVDIGGYLLGTILEHHWKDLYPVLSLIIDKNFSLIGDTDAMERLLPLWVAYKDTLTEHISPQGNEALKKHNEKEFPAAFLAVCHEYAGALLEMIEKDKKILTKIYDDDDKSTLLHQASRKGHVNIAKMLLEAGAKPNVKDEKGNTLLHLAAKKGSKEIVELLIHNGAEMMAKNKKNEIPLALALNGNHKEVVTYLNTIQINSLKLKK